MPTRTAGLSLALLLCLRPLPAQDEPCIWTVPGTRVTPPYSCAQWDARTGTLIAARRNQVLRVDPVSGASSVLGELFWESEAHRDHAGWDGPALECLTLTPDGAAPLQTADSDV